MRGDWRMYFAASLWTGGTTERTPLRFRCRCLFDPMTPNCRRSSHKRYLSNLQSAAGIHPDRLPSRSPCRPPWHWLTGREVRRVLRRRCISGLAWMPLEKIRIDAVNHKLRFNAPAYLSSKEVGVIVMQTGCWNPRWRTDGPEPGKDIFLKGEIQGCPCDVFPVHMVKNTKIMATLNFVTGFHHLCDNERIVSDDQQVDRQVGPDSCAGISLQKIENVIFTRTT